MNRGWFPGTARARPGSALALLCAASAVNWGLLALPASAQGGPDTAPSFGTDTVADQAYTETVDIGSVELPLATGGNGTLTYALACASGATGCTGTPALPPGLSFDALTRTLSGTPTATGTTRLTYAVTDADDNTTDADADTLNFTITVATAVPGPPGNLAAEARPGTVKLTWDPPAHTGASQITRHEYRYEVFGQDPSAWIAMASSAPGGTNATSYNVGELTPARIYSFWVRAVNGAGGGPESDDVTVLTKSPETPSAKHLNISKEFTDNPVVAGHGVGARTATLRFSVTNTHLTEDATDVKYTDNLDDMLPGATIKQSERGTATRCTRYDGTDVSGECDDTSSENYRQCGVRWGTTDPGEIRWWTGFTVPAQSTCYVTDVVNIPADTATGSYENTSGAVTGKYGETSVTGNTAKDTLRVRANDQPVRVEKWFSGTRNTGTPNSDGTYNHGTLEFNYRITNPNPTSRAYVTFTEDFRTFAEKFKGFTASSEHYTFLSAGATGCSAPQVRFPTRDQDQYGTFSFSTDASGRIPSDNGSCTFKVTLRIPKDVSGPDGLVSANGTYTATTKSITTTLHGNDTPLTTGDVSASVTIIEGAASEPLQFTKAFGPPAVAVAGGTVELTYTLTNPNTLRMATDIRFEHDLTEFISGAEVTSVPARPCGDDSAGTLENGNKHLRFRTGRLHAGNTCTFTVTISIPAGTDPGTYTSTTRRGSYKVDKLFDGVQAFILPVISADVLVPAVPAAPADFTAQAGDQQVTLGWAAPADTGGTGVEITGYEYSKDGSGNWTDTGATSTSHVVEALVNGTEYVFRVRARNISGAGAPTANQRAAPRPVLTISDADVEEGNADAANMTFAVTQSATSTKPVTVEYKTADPSDASLERATAGEDYDAVSDGTLTFSANTTGDALTKTVTVRVNGDTLKENDEHFAVVLHTPNGAHIKDSEGVGKITNDDENTAPSFGTETVDDQTAVAHIAMADLELPLATGGNGTLAYALACAAGQTGCEGTPALPPGLSFDAATRTLSGTPKDTGTTTLAYTVTDADDITDADDTGTLSFDLTVNANQPPTAVVGDDRTVAEGDLVTLDGSGSSDPEEQTLTYTWTAPEGITLSDAEAEQPTFDAPEVNGETEYTFTLVVNDGVQASDGASVTITVEDDTAPSFAKEVDDQTEVEHIAMADLELPAATAGNGTLTYALACAAGQTGCEGAPALPPGLSFDAATRILSGTPTATDTTTLTYTVTDADDNDADTDTGTLSFDITVNANQAPTADAGAAQTVAEGDTVTLDGSGSSDPEEQTLTYTWTAPSGSGITLSSPTAAKSSFDAPEVNGAAEYTFTLTVNDGVQDSVAASVTITVEDDVAPSFGKEVDDQTAVAQIAMEALVLSEATGGNGTLAYALACATGQTGCEGAPALPPGLSFDASTRTLSGTPTATGTTTLTYTVTDADDNDADTDAGTLSFDIAVGANQAPTADAGTDRTVAEGDTVTLDGSGSSDPEEQTLTYTWTAPDGITLSDAMAEQPTFDAPEVDGEDDYTFTLVVNDGVQDSAVASVTITVEDDTAPSFGTEVDNQTAVAHIAVDLLLPVATGGNGELSYALACAAGATGCAGTPALPPGLNFDASTRALSGTPTATGTTRLTYTVTDADDNADTDDIDSLSFDITVSANQVPTADAGDAQTVAEGDTVTLDGSGSSDPEEQTLTYTWTVPSGSGITLSSPTAAKPTFDAPQVGSDGGEYEFTLVVNDGVQASAAASVTVTVEDDVAPSFGTATVDDQTAVSHIAMEDLELPLATGGNGTLIYGLTCAAGATGCEGTPALPPGLSFDALTRTLSGTPTATGTTTLTYTVTDADDNTADTDTGTLSFDITVNANEVPTAHAGADQTVAEGDLVTLDGSGSTDPEGQTLTYAWTAPSGVSLSSATVAKPTFDAPEVNGEDDYTFTLTVNDGVQASAAASVTITVKDDAAPSFGTATVDDQTAVTYIAMEALELPAATGGNGSLTYALACASGQTGCEGTPALPPGLSFDAPTRILSGTPTATGTTTLTYTVTDGDDNTNADDTGTLSFDITVTANQAPTAHAGDDRTVAEGDTVTLDGSGSADPEGQTLTYAWTAPGGITLLDAMAEQPTFDAPEVDGTNNYTFTLTVNDGVQDSAAASVTITVEDDSAPLFGTETVDDQTEVAHIAMEALVLPLATGGNGDLSYALACAAEATGCTGTPALPPGLSFDAPTRTLSGAPTAIGTTTLTYTVTDADDNTADTDAGTLSFDITVNANQAPTAEAGAAQTVTEGDRVTLDGSGSTDPEEQTLTYAWTAPDGITLSSTSAAKPTFDAPEVDGETDYPFTLIVNDGVQDSAPASVTVTVEDDTAPSFGTATVDSQTEVAHIAMEDLVLPLATGGNGTLTYALACASGQTGCESTPALPPGLSFDASTRTLSGAPTATGTTTLTYTVTDADDNNADTDTGTLSFDITVGANQAPTANAGDDRTVAKGDTVTLDGSGSTDPEEQTLTYTWTAPSGITLSADTVVMPTFTAPTAGSDGAEYEFTLIVNDGVQESAAASVTITVKDDTAPSFGTGVDDQTAVAHIAMEDLELPLATGGNGDLSYALACAAGATGCTGTPALPPGLSFDASTRTLSGAPTAIGTTTLTYTVTDADDNTADTDTGTLSFNIDVAANQPPTAHAGDDRTVAEGDRVTLDGTGSTDPEEQTLTYTWTATDGITLSSPSAATPTFDAPEVDGEADYTFTLIVNDGLQDSAAASVTITVKDDTAPSFGTATVDDQTEVAHIAMTDLVLPAATGGNGTLTYRLACAAGATGCTGTPSLPPGLSFASATRILSGTPTATGTTTLTYTVTDADDNTASADTGTLTFDVTVGANQAPTADAGAAQTVTEGDTVTLDGSGSSDPEEQTLTYTWTAPSGITLSSTSAAQPTFTAPEVDGEADYPFTLIVNDGAQDSTAANVTITVKDDTAPSFGTETVNDQTAVSHIAMEDLVLPAATGGNGTLTYTLACASGATGCTGTPALPPGLSFAADDRQLTGTPDTPGTYSMEYTATDADDNVTATDAATLTFDVTVGANQAPTADAGAAQTVTEGDRVTLDGSGSSDPEGQTLTYAWTAPSGSGITLSSPSAAKPTFDAPAVGSNGAEYEFTLIVNDGVQDSAAASVTITVKDDTAPSFVMEVDDQTEVEDIAMEDLQLPAATGGNGTLTYALACASGQTGCEGTPVLPPGLSFDATTRTLSGTPTAVGTTTLTYTVTDADDNTDADDAGTLSFDIAVSANQPPTADAGAAQTVTEGDAVALDGSGSSDPEGQPLTYKWTAPAGITLTSPTAAMPTFTAPTLSADTPYTFTLTVNDGARDSAVASVTITVEDDTMPSFGTGTVDDQTEVVHIAMEDLQLPAATGGNGTLTYTLACASGATGCTGTPSLPPGLSFDASTRTLSGTPTATGATTLTYTATDADDNATASDAATLSFDITVGANQPPTADAGTDQTVTEGDTVTLDGSGSSDPEGQTLTYVWTAPSGSGITLSSTTAAKPTFTAPTLSTDTTYTFTLTVNDGAQDSAAASVTITVTDDTAPSFGTETVDDQTEVEDIAMADLVLPVATGGNGTLTYTLACASGATGCTGTPALPPGLSFDASTRTLSGTPTATGTTTLTYTVTDADDNVTASDAAMLTFDITVGTNQAPTAHAGAAQTVAEGDRVTLDGSGSSDPENQELTYAWTAPSGSGITLSSSTATEPTFTAPTVSADTPYTFTLIVNDGVQDSAEASVTVTVKDDTAPSFGTETVDDQTEVVHIAMADLVLPVATGGNGTLRYALACASGATGCTGTPALPPGLSFDASTRTLSGTPTAINTTTLAYTVTDADDNVTASDAATLTFDITVGANQAPTAHAGDAQTVTEGDTVTLDGSGSSDPEGQTLTYAWTAPLGSGITLSSTTAAKPTFTAPTVNADTPYTFTLTVNDGVQDSAEASSVIVTVEDDTAPSFAVEPVADQLYVKGKAISTLTLPELTLGNGVNGDHDYTWVPELPDGLTFDFSNPASLSVSGVPTLASGEATYTLTVTDANGDTDTVSVNITVEDNKEPSFAAEPLADQVYVTGKAISTLTLPSLTLGNGDNADHNYAWDKPLPAGLTLNHDDPENLTVSGTPTAVSSEDTYTLTVTDVDGDTDEVSVKITVEGAASPSFAAPTAPDQVYVKDFPITALDLPELTLGNGANADHNYKWSPALPAGLTPNHDDPASLSVSGVPTAASNEETYTLTVSDRDGDPASVSVKITVEVDVVPRFAPWDAPDRLYLKDASITPLDLPDLTPGNGDHTYAWDKALPAGLTLNHDDPENLTVSGTPTEVSRQETYTLTVTDMDEDAVTLTVRIEVTDDQTRAVTTAGLVVTKSQVAVPENGVAEFGLRLATAPTHDVTVALERSSEGDEDLRIREGASLTFTAATWETAQTVTLEAQDDADKVHGTATFLATATSVDPNYDGRTVQVEAIEVDDDAPRPPPPPVPVALPLAFAGSVNDLVYTEGKEIPGLVLPRVNGGTAPFAYELAPLPSGLVFDGDPARRRLGGTPDRPGSTPLRYTVTDGTGDTATLTFHIVVEEDLAPLFDPGMVANLKPQNYIAGNAVHLRLPVLTLGNGTNGDHSYEWSGMDGQTVALPVGLSLEGGPASLAVTGTPTEHMVSTEYTLTVTDRDGDATRLTLHIAVLEITEKPTGSEVTFDEETGEIMLRNVRFALEDGPERTWEAARIKLPAGHMVNGLALRVANLADDEAMPPDPGSLFGGVALVISPTGGLAGGAASVCLSTDGLPQGKAPRLYHEELASGVWKRINTEMRGETGLICGDVNSFSRFRAGYEAESLVQVRERALEHMLAAFGRTVATDAVSVLSGRMVDGSQGGTGSRFTLAGRTPGSRGTVPVHDGMMIGTGGDGATAVRNHGDWLGTGLGEPDLWADPAGSVTAISDRELLTGTSFQLALGAADGDAGERAGFAGGHATLWGKGRTAGFRGISAEGFALDGDVVSGWLGIDWRRSDLLLGLALSHSQGEMDYEDIDAINRDFSAQVEVDLTGVYPYARLSLDDGLDVWGIAGVGAGDLTLADGFGGNETDIGMAMAAAGARRALGSWSLRDIDFAVKGDALSVMMRSDPRGLASPDSGDDLPQVNVSAQRVRLALEGGHTRTLKWDGLVQSTLELGARYDRGGAETGVGVDLAGAVRYEDSARGLTVEGRGRLLLAHEAEGFEEWGVGGTVRLSPGANGLGYSFSMEPTWGAAASGAGRLWNDGVPTGADTAARRGRLAAEFGYGLGVFGGMGVLTPHVAASLTDDEEQDYRAGARLRLGPGLGVDVGVHRREGGDGKAELGIGLQISSGF